MVQKIKPRERDLFDWLIIAILIVGTITGAVFWVTDTTKEESSSTAKEVEERIIEKIDSVSTVVEMSNNETKKSLSKLDDSVRVVHKRVGDANKNVDDLKEKIHGLDVRQTKIETKLGSVDSRLEKVEVKIDRQ